MEQRRRQAGFTYLGLIIFVFIVGLVGAATLKAGALLERAQRETELLEIGAQFSAALKSYADATPRGQPPQPLSLQELLRDTRFPTPRRHLRKIFVDPVSGKAEWGIVSAGEGGRILGVHSLSQVPPLKQARFDERFPNFENREHIAQWKFMATGQGAAPAPLQPPGTLAPVTMAPPPEQPAGPVAAPVAPQAPMQELAPPPREPEPEAEPEPEPQEEPPQEPPAEEDKDKDKPKEPPPAQDSGR
ncbi:type II secretion system protein [Massilia yuzhufengensis]|uniref:Type II secretory pathway, pseudopilin PulG n=1 Tax=Massilia yuzhufengensis TaxID=1164594 RepID=A0A1I1PCA6_9BURK|nr:type II secretion system protein [Massilia yuzhufengensis]SFD07346.1 Type II secretory pathway, pseudopilin PulG [Massilia yuzhufengensis]